MNTSVESLNIESKNILEPKIVSQESSGIMQVIISCAENKDIDIERIKELKLLYDEIKQEELRVGFDRAKAIMQAELPAIEKNIQNQFSNYKYADWGTINKKVQPVLSSHGFSLSFEVADQTDTTLTIRAVLSYENGYRQTDQITMPIDSTGTGGKATKIGPQAIISTKTYAQKTLGVGILNISIVGEDPDGDAPDVCNSPYHNIIRNCSTIDELEKLRSEIRDDRSLVEKQRNLVIQAFRARKNELEGG